jgi:hypothetical protein
MLDLFLDLHNLGTLHLQVKTDFLVVEAVVHLLPHTHQVLEVKAVKVVDHLDPEVDHQE